MATIITGVTAAVQPNFEKPRDNTPSRSVSKYTPPSDESSYRDRSPSDDEGSSKPKARKKTQSRGCSYINYVACKPDVFLRDKIPI
jgi:hypothetical protein